MRCLWIGCLLMACVARLAIGTCVFDSDFGFILNCNFKKSSLFRVRNLGGVKAHFGLGFSVGDELGFPESLGNLEGNKRRSLSDRDTAAAANSIGVLPASRLPPIQQNRPQALTPTTSYKKSSAIAMTEAVSLPLGVPAFRPIPASVSDVGKRATIQPNPVAQNTFNRKTMQQYPSNIMSQLNNLTFATGQPFRAAQTTSNVVQKIPKSVMPMSNVGDVPAFQAMPSSVSRISTGQIVHVDNVNDLATKSFSREDARIQTVDAQKMPRIQPQTSPLPQVDLRGHTVEELARVANVSVETIQNAIRMRQQQLMLEQQSSMYKQMDMSKTATPTRPPTRPPTTTTTTTTTTQPPPTTPKYVMNGGSKVMNAPKEYYPVGYDKNFDDNFMSKVDLPSTSFHCGDQKHFPGLYADIDLGCMVFHVCALTDDGLIMKSFLCPESTLFDQTVLKCNWWFYVDCKGSRNLYDSNLPVSKSYQLMKALTFFSKYKNNQKEGGTDGGVDVEALKNSVALSDLAP